VLCKHGIAAGQENPCNAKGLALHPEVLVRFNQGYATFQEWLYPLILGRLRKMAQPMIDIHRALPLLHNHATPREKGLDRSSFQGARNETNQVARSRDGRTIPGKPDLIDRRIRRRAATLLLALASEGKKTAQSAR
jgi:hypothetical protein